MRFVIILLAAVALMLAVAVDAQWRACQSGSVFRRACNTCRCNRDGTDMACTRKQCLPDFYGFPDAPGKKICEPGSFFKMDCNDCRCNTDGTNAACTLKGCPHA